MNNAMELFGSMVFNDSVMQERLPKATYAALKSTRDEGKELDPAVANVIAHSMKEWAIGKGVTHFTHWFQPMTGITAEKHDSFLSPIADGRAITTFSGKELIKGEPDASSFPSGGLRATFEARGYTAWDTSSYAFIKDNTLCIPTAFYSYSGQVLDKKTPLLRSMAAIDIQARRILALFGDTSTKKVTATVGAEQEYFLIDKDLYKRRPDLLLCGRTLFGSKPPKGQELEDHYFGAIRPRVREYMEDLDRELWKIGVYAKTHHNEAAPSQHELAPIFSDANTAADGNQLTMELMKKVAIRHNFACLLHEKPFAGINGSGKHNNWSLSTDAGENLLEPGDAPGENTRFLLFLTAVIKAVDEYQDVLRLSVATAANDHRLGAAEAPPAIMSIFLGSELTGVLEAIEEDRPYIPAPDAHMATGVNVIPDFIRDTSDRNRTSPFAFTGNKFEFRMLGSSLSISGPTIVINTVVADVLRRFADRLEGAGDVHEETCRLIRETVSAHKRIIFNGNNYAEEWVEEARARGLLDLRTAADALPLFKLEKNIDVFARVGVFTRQEIYSRTEILLQNYCKVLNIEALTMLDMARRDIFPAVSAYVRDLCSAASAKAELGIGARAELSRIEELSALQDTFALRAEALERTISGATHDDMEQRAMYLKENVVPAMAALRETGDAMEVLCAKKHWPYPTYAEMLF